MYWNDASWWAWIPMTLGMIAVWGLLIWGAVQLVGGQRPADRRPQTAPEILDERLGRGEIGRDEYLELHRLLEDRSSDHDPAAARGG